MIVTHITHDPKDLVHEQNNMLAMDAPQDPTLQQPTYDIKFHNTIPSYLDKQSSNTQTAYVNADKRPWHHTSWNQMRLGVSDSTSNSILRAL